MSKFLSFMSCVQGRGELIRGDIEYGREERRRGEDGEEGRFREGEEERRWEGRRGEEEGEQCVT